MYCFKLLRVEFVAKEKGKVLIPMIFNEKWNKITTPPQMLHIILRKRRKLSLSKINILIGDFKTYHSI